MFPYLEIKEDNPLHFQCLTANVSHHDSLRLLTLGRVVLGFSVSAILLHSYQKTSPFRFGCLLRFADSALFRSRFSVFGKNEIGFLDLQLDAHAVWCFSGFSSETICASFDQNSLRFCGLLFLIIICTVLRSIKYSNVPLFMSRILKNPGNYYCNYISAVRSAFDYSEIRIRLLLKITPTRILMLSEYNGEFLHRLLSKCYRYMFL